MLAAYAGPITYMVAVLVAVSVAGTALGRRALAMGPVGIAGALMYPASTFAMNSWRLVDGLEAQTFAWHTGLAIDIVLYAGVMIFVFRNSYRLQRIAISCMVIGVVLFATQRSLPPGEAQIWEVLTHVVIAAMATACFLEIARGELVARMFWGVLMIGETVAIFQTADCQLLHGMLGKRFEGSACEQVYGADLSLAPLAITTAFWLYLMWRWFDTRK